ncbi:MAG: hypothetical protein HY720_01875 [Planctomycetes bacterium]|nr:hypothetical protein [Planctomycetota bacterium]
MIRIPAATSVVLALSLVLSCGCGSEDAGGNEGENAKPEPAPDPVADSASGNGPSAPDGGGGPADLGQPDGRGKGILAGVLDNTLAKRTPGVVYVEYCQGSFELLAAHPIMDQLAKAFTPHVLAVLAGSTVDFPNSDDVRHSVYTKEGSANDYNLGQYPTGEVKHVEHPKTGVTQLACNIHAEMSGYVISLQNPFFAVTDKGTARFTIPDVPSGKYRLAFFHEKLQSVSSVVTVEPGKTTEVVFRDLKRK